MMSIHEAASAGDLSEVKKLIEEKNELWLERDEEVNE